MFFILGFWTFIVLLILNATTGQDWSWFIVTAPLWIGAILDIIFLTCWVALHVWLNK